MVGAERYAILTAGVRPKVDLGVSIMSRSMSLKAAVSVSMLSFFCGCPSVTGVTELSSSGLVPGNYVGTNVCTVRELGTVESVQEIVPLGASIGQSGIPLVGGVDIAAGAPIIIGTIGAIVESVVVTSDSVRIGYILTDDIFNGTASEVYEQVGDRTILLSRAIVAQPKDDPAVTLLLECSATLTR